MRYRASLLVTVLLAASAQAQTVANGGQPPAPAVATPANWPTAQFVSSKDPSVQKALAILNDMIRALGADTYLNVRNMQMEGRSYGFYHGQPNSLGVLFWRFWEFPDKDRWEFTKQRDVIELTTGDKGYEITYKGTGTQDPKQLSDYLRRREHSLEWVIRKWLPAPGTMILYGGPAMVEQNLADQVTILNAANDSVTLAINPRTHLPVKKTYSWRDPNDRQRDEEAEIFSNYKLVQGIQTPYATVRNENGEMSNQRFITSVTYNNDFAPTLFETKGITYNPPKSK
ncbi:MAG: hypothetical protein P4M04_11475 [Acidobacteriota bacterium]|nr:hypothetical protein [Acidobacteriota bacterium]